MSSLTIDSQSLDIPGAWEHNRSLRRLRSTVRSRGQNRVIPGESGTTAYAVVRDEVIVDMELMVYGRMDRLGSPYSDTVAGLDENLAYLDDWVADHIDGSTKTWPAVFVSPADRTFTADVQILNWQIAQEHGTTVVMSYDLRVPAGIWVESP